MTKPASSGRTRLFAWLLLRNSLIFALVYGGADRLTALHSFRLPVALPFETRLPVYPAAVLAYLSIYGLFAAALYFCRDNDSLRGLARAQLRLILVSGIGFLLIPAQPEYPPVAESALGIWSGPFHFADRVNLTYNLVPSLHVALSVACVRYYVPTAGPAARVLLWGWAALIAASTLLTHQHHLLDVATGWILALVVTRNARCAPAGRG